MKYTTKKYCPIETINRYPSAVEWLREKINRDLYEAIINEAEKGEVIVRFGEVKEEAQAEFNGMTTFRREINIKPLIRCKDCKHRKRYTTFAGSEYYMCDHDSDPHSASRSAEEDEWFCADGEARE